ncbi:pro-adrenomedullin-like [Erpetoichthys calabaricus]|uniref:Pro-adrenomedullin n=1 Tax=Erpetoichthys calabaricus TaxID=27687 RepID=A0A8C4RUF8_ERPCA|nr:pro-adrenomedullin-like [Erpetoichthys calabaricus]
MNIFKEIVLFYWCLLTFTFLNAETTKLDLTSNVRKKFSIWALSKVKRSLDNLPESKTLGMNKEQFIRPEDVIDSLSPRHRSDVNIRVKRYKHSLTHQSLRVGCNLGTCTVHELANRLYKLTNTEKDNNAPIDKINQYGKRRRRSLPVRRVGFYSLAGRLQPVWIRTSDQSGKLRGVLKHT